MGDVVRVALLEPLQLLLIFFPVNTEYSDEEKYGAQSGKSKEKGQAGIEQSYDTAMSYFLASYQDESLEETDFKGPRYAADLYDSGYTHDDGTWEEPDYVAAEECYLIAAAGNGRTYDSTASYKLGVYYEEGRDGIEQDYEQALYYFELTINNSSVHSTMLGVPRCYLSLANFYENGLGTDADIDTVIYYYQMALAAANDNLALENTGSEDSDMEDVAATATAALEALGAPLEMETETDAEG
ncbi:MAG: hypothetical protein LUF35_05395 [Lachnospiraceae bacterium]|nr:hypothetical protein [Lachnospiraceae bacterium]